MAQAYWQNEMTGHSTFSLFFRQYPPDRGYFVLSGVDDVLDYLDGFRFTSDDIDALRHSGKFDTGFLDYLVNMRFECDVRAMREGSIFFINEPVIEISGPVIEAQIVETLLVNQINIQTILATKASRVVHAAQGRTLVDFAARRTHGMDAANALARASYMVGFAGTSNVMAGCKYGIPTFGTVAHSFVTAFDHEIDSFRAYARSFPDSSTFLVDSYDTFQGVRHAVQVAREMRETGHDLRSVRLDSGDLLELSAGARQILDEGGFPNVQVFASGGLDEFSVADLVEKGAPIDGFGVGTKVGVSADAPWTDCAYKLVEYEGRPVLKLSTGKNTLPAPKQVFRSYSEAGEYDHDVIACADEHGARNGGEPMLHPVMSQGRRIAPRAPLDALRAAFTKEFDRLPEYYKSLRSPGEYPVGISGQLRAIQSQAVERIEQAEV
jgi:nicotinate phosphoribosyltransferase